MELRHLRYFVVVAEELHFRRAAERLHMSQPPLSQQIRALEEEVGATLLLRNQRRVELTAAGVVFLERARQILADVEDAARQARRVQRGEVGRLAVGFVGSAMYSFVPDLLRRFGEHAPDVTLRLHEMGTTEQLRQLEDGRLDVGFLRAARSRPELKIEIVAEEPVIVALPDLHPLAAKPRLTLADLEGQPLILLTTAVAPGLRSALQPAIDRLGGEDTIVQEVPGDADRDRPGGRGRGHLARGRVGARAGARRRDLPGASTAGGRACAWTWPGGRRTNRRWSRRSWRWRARRPPPKEREVDGGRRYVDVAPPAGRRDMYPLILRGGEPPSRREGMYETWTESSNIEFRDD